MDFTSHRILVTGGTGFLGSYVIRYLLQAGCSRIVATKRKDSSFDLLAGNEEKAQWVEADIRDYKAMESAIADADIIIHIAAMVSFVHKDADALMQINAYATGQIVDLALRYETKKFIYVSSVAALGRSDISKAINEDAVWVDSKTNSKYAISKQWGEREVWRGLAEGMDVAILNPSFILGGGYWDEGPTSLYQKIYKGLSFYPTGSNGIVDVRDAAQLVLQLLQQDVVGERYIACAKSISHRDLFSSIAKYLNKKPPHRKVTPLMGTLAAMGEGVKAKLTGRRPIVTKETIATSSLHVMYDNSKSIDALGFTYRDPQATISEICTCYLASIQSGKNYGVLDL